MTDNKEAVIIKEVKKHKVPIIAFGVLVLAVIILAMIAFGGAPKTERITNSAIKFAEVIETFEISTLDFEYTDSTFEKNTTDRKFLFIKLDPAVKMYCVQYDGSLKIGVDGKDIRVDESSAIGEDGKKHIKVTIPEAKIISHVAPKDGSFNLLFDEVSNTEEHYSIKEYQNTLDKRKEAIVEKARKDGFFERARESAGTQIKNLFNAIPGFGEEYTMEIIMP